MQQPMMQQPAPMGGALLGRLMMHLKEAKLQFHDGPMLERMSPYVTVKINGREERSPICEGGGKNPSWMGVKFDFEVVDMNHMIEIVVRDKDMMIGGEMLGASEIPMGKVAIASGFKEWIELFMNGVPAGRIQFKCEYHPQAAIVNPQPMVQQTVVTQQVVVDPALKQGVLKVHAVKAHLDYHEGPMLERMSPFVEIRIGGQTWRNDVCEGGGRNPEWGGFNHMEHVVVDPMAEVFIQVRDKDMMIGSEFIGEARVPVNMFLKPVEVAGKVNEEIQLRRMDFAAGRIHLRSEFIPEVAMAAGGGGRGGPGVGKAVAAGVITGAIVGAEIASHEHHRGRFGRR